MKLALREEDGCSILSVQGEIDEHNFGVLKAGLSKLFKSGKNRIVLHLEDAGNLPDPLLQELAILDVFARELSGKLLIASEHLDLQTRASALQRPPLYAIQPTVEAALTLFKEGDANEAMDFALRLQQSEARAASLEAQLKLKDGSDSQALREENAELRERVKLLEAQLGEFAAQRPQPSFTEGFLEKCEALEEAVRKLGAEKAAQEGAKR